MKIIKNNIFLIIIVILLTLNVVTLYGSIILYERLMKAQLDPTGTWFDIYKKNVGSPNCLFIGDSRVSQWKVPPSFCKSFMYGFSGFTSSQIFLALPMLEVPDSVDTVFLQLGINDLKTIGLYEDKEYDIRSNLMKNLDGIALFFVKKNIKVYITTIIPAGKISYPRKLIWTTLVDESVDEINRYLLRLNVKGIEVIDAAIEFNQRYELYKDELHLNSKGYEKLNEVIIKSFNNK